MKIVTLLFASVCISTFFSVATAQTNDQPRKISAEPSWSPCNRYPAREILKPVLVPVVGAMRPTSAGAALTKAAQEPRKLFGVVTLTGGALLATPKRQSYTETGRDFHYVPAKMQGFKNISPVFGIFLGVEHRFKPGWAWQIGPSYYYSATNQNGLVTEPVPGRPDDPDIFAYAYSVRTQRLMLENKLLGTIGKSFHPYVSGAIGVAYNQFADWRTVLVQKSTIGQNQRTPQFANNTMTSLTYSIGVGFDEDITEHIRLGIGYRFSDLGEVRAGNGTIAMPLPPSPLPVLFKPSQRLQAHEVVAQLTYLF